MQCSQETQSESLTERRRRFTLDGDCHKQCRQLLSLRCTIRQKHTASVIQCQLRTQVADRQQTRSHVYVKIGTYTLDRFFKFREVGAIHGEDTSINLCHVHQQSHFGYK